ncbi:MAG: sigma factor regulatory protein [Pseudomonadota bacterium]|jgi:sigma-E factor negative regulatory protein RseB
MRPLRFLLILLILAPSGVRAEEDGGWLDSGKKWVQQLWRDDSEAWLGRINAAVANHNYKGVLVLVQGAEINTLAVEHRMDNGAESLRMRTLSGSPRELVKKGGRIQSNSLGGSLQSFPAAATGQITFSHFANAAGNKSYKVRLSEKARVAGRATQVIDILAEDLWRYSYRLWLDTESGLPLKVVTLDERGYALEQFVFTQIDITPAAGKAKPAKAPQNRELKSPFKEVKGFRVIASESRAGSTHYLFSDGLASISLYVEPSKQKEKAQMRRDGVNGLMLGDGSIRYVAMGKVPVATLEKILAQTQR